LKSVKVNDHNLISARVNDHDCFKVASDVCYFMLFSAMLNVALIPSSNCPKTVLVM